MKYDYKKNEEDDIKPSFYMKTDFPKFLFELNNLVEKMNETKTKQVFDTEERITQKTNSGSLRFILRTRKFLPGMPIKSHPKTKSDYCKQSFVDSWKYDGYID